MHSAQSRLPSLDILRGTALLGMIAFHAAYDLQQYWQWDIDVFHGAWRVFARTTATAFLLVSGIAVACSERHMHDMPRGKRWQKRLTRFGVTGLFALCVSAATFALNPRTAVVFGILHLLATSRLLLPLCLRLGAGNIVLGVLCIACGWGAPWEVSTSLAVPFGLVPQGFASVDYFPLLPWFGVPLIGMGIVSHPAGRRMVEHPSDVYRRMTPLAWLGKRSLIVYLAHQPLLFTLLTALFGTPPAL